MSAIESKVDELRKRLIRVFFLRRLLDLITVWLFTFGGAVLLLRFLGIWTSQALLLNLVVLPLCLLAWRDSQKGLPTKTALRAWLDKNCDCGGLLMADAERSLGAWQVASPTLPRISWPRRDVALRLAAAFLFLALATLLPNKWVVPFVSGGIDLVEEVADLKEKIDVLAEESIINAAEKERLEQTLDRLGEEAEGDDPGKSWEAMDHLNQSLARRAEEALADMDRLAEEQGLLAQIAETLETNRQAVDPADFERAQAELSELTSRMAAEDKALAEALQSMEASKSMDGAMSLAEMAKALNLSQDQLKQMAARLEEARLVKLSQYKNLQRGKAGDGKEALAAFLSKNLQEGGAGGLAKCMLPGRGGISKGGGATELTWTDPTNRDGVGFETMVLNQSDLNEWNQSYQTGLSSAAPKAGETRETNHDALTGSKSGSGSAFTHRLLPRHRKAVKRFFEKSDKAND